MDTHRFAGLKVQFVSIPLDGLSMLSAVFEDAFAHAQCQFSRQMAERKFPSLRYAQIRAGPGEDIDLVGNNPGLPSIQPEVISDFRRQLNCG